MVGPSLAASSRSFASQLNVMTALKYFPFLSRPKTKWDFKPASGSRHAFPECTWGMQLSTAKLLPCQCQSCRRERGDWARHNKPGSCACRQTPKVINHGPEGREKYRKQEDCSHVQQAMDLGIALCLLQALCITFVTYKSPYLYRMGAMFWNLFLFVYRVKTKDDHNETEICFPLW